MPTLSKKISRGRITPADLSRLLNMSPNSIMTAADKARTDLREQLGSDAACVALAAALGRASAESGIPLDELVAMAEIARKQASCPCADVAA